MSHILRAQWARVVSGDCIGEHRYKTFASLLYWMGNGRIMGLDHLLKIIWIITELESLLLCMSIYF